jgi:hypothetical protein
MNAPSLGANISNVLAKMQALHPVNGYNACPDSRREMQQSKTTSDRISLDSQAVNQAKERRRLTKEQEIVRESLDGGDGSPVLCQRGPDH